MGRGRSVPKEDRHPELGTALRWLRHRLHLTQDEVVAAAAANGDSLSKVYYSQCERGGDQYPSPTKLEIMLRALRSDQAELEGLLNSRPWVDSSTFTSTSTYRPSKTTPKPLAYASGDASVSSLLAQVTGAENAAPESLTAAPEMGGPIRARSMAAPVKRLRSLGPQPEMPMLGELAGFDARTEVPSTSPQMRGELAEIADVYVRASRQDQLTMLGMARKLRAK